MLFFTSFHLNIGYNFVVFSSKTSFLVLRGRKINILDFTEYIYCYYYCYCPQSTSIKI